MFRKKSKPGRDDPLVAIAYQLARIADSQECLCGVGMRIADTLVLIEGKLGSPPAEPRATIIVEGPVENR